MKTAGKVVLGIFIGIVLIFVGIIGLGVLIDMGVLKSSTDEPPEIRIEYKPHNIGESIEEESIPDSQYYSTVQEALHGSKITADAEKLYQKNMDEIIAQFENENYISVYFKSVKNEDVACITFAKFKKKVIDGDEKYTFLRAIPREEKRGAILLDDIKTLVEDQLMSSDFKQSINIDPEHTRFVYGDCHSKEIYHLKVEGQVPTEIIPYEVVGETRYFWYYENLESDIAGSQLQFTLD